MKEKTKECGRLARINALQKNKMEAIVMRLTKEIEERKKNKEKLSQSLKVKSEECCRLENENGQLMSDLQNDKEHEEDLGKQILIFKYDLDVANEYKEKF